MMRRLLGRYWPLLLGLLAVLLVRQVLLHLTFSATTDAMLMLTLGTIISISVLIMLLQTDDWTLRALGVFGLIVFDAAYYNLNGTIGLWGWPPVTPGLLSTLRAMIVVAAVLLLTSQILHIGRSIRCRRRKRAEP
jgi:hypothetical protein